MFGIPGLTDARRRTIAAPRNPLDKSTIVSIFPKDITETKVTIQPGSFHIKAGSFENPSILVVTSSSWWREIDAEQPLVEITNSSIQVAESIVKDYCNGLLGCDMNESLPGLFYVPGEHTVEKIKKDFKALLEKANIRQINWFKVLVQMGDTGWARSNGNPVAISEDMRTAANILGLKDKDWMKDFTMLTMTPCFACGSPRNPQFPICPACRAIDMQHPEAKNLHFANA